MFFMRDFYVLSLAKIRVNADVSVYMCVLLCVCFDFEPAGRLVLAAGCLDCLKKERGAHRTSTGT